ncbi:MAG: shikimate dehydrogenase [Saprospiraceae bacterium]|nr:shikimate dehydrogenase [Saprospiraceae bacterium]
MRRYGLIGRSLGHSFSKGYFTEKFLLEGIDDAIYELFPLEKVEDLSLLLAQYPDLCGLNVTIPYKETVMPLLHQLDDTAREVGAVNCIKIMENGRLKGFNTDVAGFEYTLIHWNGWKPDLGPALILGTGGASKAVSYVLRKQGIAFQLVSRNPSSEQERSYESLADDLTDYRLIVNTTPAGTFPGVDQMPPIPLDLFHNGMFVIDLIYNPAETLLLHEAKKRGCIVKNGMEMLEQQAEAAWALWQS